MNLCNRFEWDFSAKPNRLIFQNVPERYDYAKINSRTNKDREVDTGKIQVASAEYKEGVGISFNILNALKGTGLDERTAKSNMFEMLNAMDESLVSEKGIQRGVDVLDTYLKEGNVKTFSIQDGYIIFLAEDGTEVMKLPIISSRQSELRNSYYEARDEATEGSREEQQDLIRDVDLRRDVRRQAREAREAQGVPDDTMAVKVELPKRGARQPFYMPKDYWIGSDKPPVALEKRHEDEIICMAHAGEMLRREVGGLHWLHLLGFKEKDEAWQFKRDLLQRDGAEVVANMDGYVRVRGGVTEEVGTDNSGYVRDLLAFKQDVENASGEGWPMVMCLYYKHSDFKAKVARFNSRVKPEYGSLNSHIAYSLGKGFRKVDASPSNGEAVKDYLARALHLKPIYRGLLTDVRVRVDGRDVPSNFKLSSGQSVEMEDFYFSHLYRGSKINSFTELVGSGNFVPTDMLRLNLDHEGIDKSKIAVAPAEQALKPVDCFYLKKGQSLKQVFQEKVSTTETDWENYRWYLKLIGFEAEKVKVYTEPVPVPDMVALSQYIETVGGIEGLIYAENKEKCRLYNEQHPSEHVVFIEKREYPWDILKDYFFELGSSLTKKERDYVIGEIDKLNKTVDLRLYEKPVLHGDEVVEVSDYVSWQVGSYFWFNDEVIEALKYNIKRERIMSGVYVPPSLDVAVDTDKFQGPREFITGKIDELLGNDTDTSKGSKKVDISEHEARYIERATNEPDIRMFLTLALLNEQKSTGWLNRGVVSEYADKIPGYNEKSIGMFRVRPRDTDVAILEREGYVFADYEAYKQALRDNHVLNAHVAAMRFVEARDSYDYFLRLNGDKPDVSSDEYVAGVLTCYNRSRRDVYNGLLSAMGQRVSVAFDLGVDYSEFELPTWRYEGYYGYIPDEFMKDVPDSIKSRFPKKLETKIYGKDRHGASNFWASLGQKMIDDDLISLSEEQISFDLALLHSERESLDTSGMKPVEAISKLIIFNKSKFFQTEFYKAVKEAYKVKTGEDNLSFLIEPDEFESTAIENYGYRVVRYGQRQAVLDYSFDVNFAEAQGMGLEDSIEIGGLNSVRQKRGLPLNITIGDQVVEVRTDFKSGEPFSVELTEEEKSKLPEVNSNGLISILLTGGRSADDSHGGGLPDSIKQILVNPRIGDVVVVSLPRDVRVTYQDRSGRAGNSRLNAVKVHGGQEAFLSSVADITGQDVVHTLNFDFEAMEQNIDEIIAIIGNIEFDDPRGKHYSARVGGICEYFGPHVKITSGQQALNYARFRHGWEVYPEYALDMLDEDGRYYKIPDDHYMIAELDATDKARTDRQNLLISAIFEKMMQPDNFARVLLAAPGMFQNFDTNFSGTDYVTEVPKYLVLANSVRNTGKKPKSISVEGLIQPKESSSGAYLGEQLVTQNAYIDAINAEFMSGDLSGSSIVDDDDVPAVADTTHDTDQPYPGI